MAEQGADSSASAPPTAEGLVRVSGAATTTGERLEPVARPGAPLPLVAIVGRPNVGKSSLFNAILGRRSAIVAEEAGTTRDRMIAEAEFEGCRFLLADTGGLVPEPETEMEAHITAQVDAAIDAADAVLFVTDARGGPGYADEAAAHRLRQSGKPVALAVNKADNPSQEALSADAYSLKLGEPLPVSALHRRGIGDLLDAVLALLPSTDEAAPAPDTPRIAIIGRPNVGKSALTNAILGQERSIVSAAPGTTRDALDSAFEFEGVSAALIDTAGVRRRGAVQPGIEKFSVLRAAAAIHRCDVAIVVMDATQPATDQDLHIAGQAAEAFKAVVVAVNKWDLITKLDPRRETRRFTNLVRSRMRFLSGAPVVFTSATEGEGVEELLRTAFALNARRNAWVDGPTLTRTVMEAVARRLPPSGGAKGSLKLYRVKQDAARPPTFVFYVNNTGRIHFSYERYLANRIREAFEYDGVPLKIEFRGKGGVHVIGDNRAKAAARARNGRSSGHRAARARR